MKFTDKYQPTNLNECLYPDQQTEDLIKDAAANLTALNLVLYGPMGTGKSLMAELIATELASKDIVMIEPFQGATLRTPAQALEVVKLIEKRTKTLNFFSDRILYLIDEFDRIDFDTQLAFGHLMSMKELQFILTTNNVANIDQRLLSRAHPCNISGGTQQDMMTLAQHVIQTEGVTATQIELDNLVTKASGNVRDLLNGLEAFVLRKRRVLARTATLAIPAVPLIVPTVQLTPLSAVPTASVLPVQPTPANPAPVASPAQPTP